MTRVLPSRWPVLPPFTEIVTLAVIAALKAHLCLRDLAALHMLLR
jgi:hypothetical protein